MCVREGFVLVFCLFVGFCVCWGGLQVLFRDFGVLGCFFL